MKIIHCRRGIFWTMVWAMIFYAISSLNISQLEELAGEGIIETQSLGIDFRLITRWLLWRLTLLVPIGWILYSEEKMRRLILIRCGKYANWQKLQLSKLVWCNVYWHVAFLSTACLIYGKHLAQTKVVVIQFIHMSTWILFDVLIWGWKQWIGTIFLNYFIDMGLVIIGILNANTIGQICLFIAGVPVIAEKCLIVYIIVNCLLIVVIYVLFFVDRKYRLRME